ncbi:MAG: HEAT repeat domain-containing protein [Myxococcales bacterium]|nr:HEAT repeat domain-containing protein [Myxococcales bacterium]
MGIAAVPHLIAHLDGERRGDPESAVELLEELGDVQATLALIRELSRGRIPQSTTLRALSSLGDSRALLPMLALLDDPSPAVRLGAMHGLEPLLGEPTAAADIMAERLADTDPRIRLLAARYLGKMRARSAVPKLIAAAAPGEEFILRATALQALGAIGDSRATPHALQYLASDTPALAAVAADVLSELADPTAVTRLLAIAHTVEHPSRIFAIEALGSTVRGKSDAKVADLFLSLARGHDQAGALAGIEALSCMRDERSGTALLRLLSTENPERQRAAAMALGALGHAPAFAPLLASLRTQPARVGSSVALALGELGNEKAIPQLISTSQRRGTARAVNASAALARLATPNHTQEIAPLLLHANALVRINALAALGRNKDAHLASKIERMLSNDPSWLVRIASARTLSMLGSSTEALRRASEQDDRREVRKAAKELLETAYVPVDTNRWSVFRIVDPLRNDRPIAHEARFFIGADGIATVGISDIRGRIYSQTFPEGPYVQGPLSNLSGF